MDKSVFAEGIEMTKAFTRGEGNDGAAVFYPLLDELAAKAKQLAPIILDEFWGCPSDSIEEEERARKAAIGYLVLTGQQLRDTPQRFRTEVADRFTRSAVEIYGEPEEEQFQSILKNKITEIEALRLYDPERADNLLALMNRYVSSEGKGAPDTSHELLIVAQKIKSVINNRYLPVLEVFNLPSDRPLSQAENIELCNQGRLTLGESDKAWLEWKIVPHDKVASETDGNEKIIYIGTKKKTVDKVKSTFCHEAFGHALRQINSNLSGDFFIEQGLPGHYDTEEGLGLLIEYGFSEVIPDIRFDRYIDFGMALGKGRGPRLNRQQMHDLYVSRSILRQKSKGSKINLDSIDTNAWHYVNRLYRGSPAIDEVAVNTKDIAYPNGFIKVGNYIKEELAGGKSIESILDYIFCAKFDPTNPRHRAYIGAHLNRQS